MNLAQLKAAALRNRTPLLVGAAGIVAVIALRNRSKAPATSADQGDTSTRPAYYTAGSVPTYDSTGSDVYNALQAPLQDLTRAVDDLRGRIPVPVPTQPTPTKATGWPVPTLEDQGVQRRLLTAARDATRRLG